MMNPHSCSSLTGIVNPSEKALSVCFIPFNYVFVVFLLVGVCIFFLYCNFEFIEFVLDLYHCIFN